ncbi:phosphate ABC transporter permease [Natrialba chahannaoensis JCM 10990]|uniref:Phosphate transport system permease protein n=1 Tax=Natrialba chahannaoensis JCM 10990 TaxID=1227492 RepID=M0A8Z0_9EURY|nr:phosphate ABC transporter permease subunit PstC [Natrialba chahannaoensis]ELY94836.1 phosphate ABC transporter permease [Natrialba chahannaoensis JCM 10990]
MSTETQSGSGISGDDSLEAAHEKNRRVRRVLFGCAAVTVVTTVAIFLVLFDNAASYFFGARISEVLFDGDSIARTVTFTEFFTGTRWAPDHATPAHGVLPIVWGTLAITIGAGLVSIPIGTATALYLSEYASSDTRNRLKPILEILAGIPTIVYGYFAVSFLTPVLVDGIATFLVNPAGRGLDSVSHHAPGLLEPLASGMMGASVGRYSMLAGILVVGTMTIPMVSSISEDAMQAVPDDLRNGAYALGATKYQVSTRIVLPAAVSGIFASYILALSRAIGETMAVTMAAGFNANLTVNPFDEIMTMTAYLVSMARGTSAVGTVQYQSLFAVGLLLFLMTLTMNLLNDRLKQRFQEEYR